MFNSYGRWDLHFFMVPAKADETEHDNDRGGRDEERKRSLVSAFSPKMQRSRQERMQHSPSSSASAQAVESPRRCRRGWTGWTGRDVRTICMSAPFEREQKTAEKRSAMLTVIFSSPSYTGIRLIRRPPHHHITTSRDIVILRWHGINFPGEKEHGHLFLFPVVCQPGIPSISPLHGLRIADN